MEDANSGKAKQLNNIQRKRSLDDLDQTNTSCRKMRSLSGYNLWHSQYMRSPESQQFSSLVEKNKQSALKWRSLTDEERYSYCRDAAAHNCGDAVVNEKKEADKIIRHLVDMGEHADKLTSCMW